MELRYDANWTAFMPAWVVKRDFACNHSVFSKMGRKNILCQILKEIMNACIVIKCTQLYKTVWIFNMSKSSAYMTLVRIYVYSSVNCK